MQVNKNNLNFFGCLSKDRIAENISEDKCSLVKGFSENSLNSKQLLDLVKYLEFFSQDDSFVKSYKTQLLDNAQAVSLYSLISQDFIQKEQRKQYKKEFILKDLNIITNPVYEDNFLECVDSLDVANNIDLRSNTDETLINNDWHDKISLLLQATFSHILLDIYMPKQDELLGLLGKELNYNSLGQDFLGSVLETIPSFTVANVNYNLASYISQTMGTNNFSTTFSAAQTKLNDEIIQSGKDMDVVDDVLVILNRKLNEIQSNGDLTPEQITSMSEMLTGYISSLEISKSNLLDLMNLLKSLTIHPDANNGFMVTGPSNWQASLIKLEAAVVSGSSDVSGANNSGLLEFFNTCMNQQLRYGDLAQSQQLTLQLELAAIQQEWTIVSSSLRILNKIFMSLAGKIKR